MTKIGTLIVDDERLARQRLRRMLASHEEIEILGEAIDGASAIESVRELHPDLLLLDIQMPGSDGFEVVQALGTDAPPVVIFVTAFDQHALRAFDACALDYLLKPVSPARLNKALARAADFLRSFKNAAPAAGDARSSASLKFPVRSGQRTSFVAADEIDWVEASGNYAILHLGPQNHLLRATMGSLENDLPVNFVRTSRSSIVNLRSVKQLQSAEGAHFVLMKDDVRVPLTGSVREMQERLRAL